MSLVLSHYLYIFISNCIKARGQLIYVQIITTTRDVFK